MKASRDGMQPAPKQCPADDRHKCLNEKWQGRRQGHRHARALSWVLVISVVSRSSRVCSSCSSRSRLLMWCSFSSSWLRALRKSVLVCGWQTRGG